MLEELQGSGHRAFELRSYRALHTPAEPRHDARCVIEARHSPNPPRPISTMAISMTSKSPRGGEGVGHDKFLSRPSRNAHTQAPTVPDPRILEVRAIHMSDRISFLASWDGDGADCRAPSVLVGPCAALGGPWGASPATAGQERGACGCERAASPTTQDVTTRRARRSAAFPGVLPAHDAIAAGRARHKKGMDGGWRPMEPKLGRSASRSRRASVSPGRGRLPPPTLSPRLHSHTRTPHATGEDPADRGFADSQTHPRFDARPPVRRAISRQLVRALIFRRRRRRARALGTPGIDARLALNSCSCPPIPAYAYPSNYTTTAPSWRLGACGPHQFGDATRPGLLIGAREIGRAASRVGEPGEGQLGTECVGRREGGGSEEGRIWVDMARRIREGWGLGSAARRALASLFGAVRDALSQTRCATEIDVDANKTVDGRDTHINGCDRRNGRSVGRRSQGGEMETWGRGGHRGGITARTDRLGASRRSHPPDLDDENGDPTPALASQEDRRRGRRDAQARRRILYGVSAVTMQRPRTRTDDERAVSGVSRACVWQGDPDDGRAIFVRARMWELWYSDTSSRARVALSVLWLPVLTETHTHTRTYIRCVLRGPCRAVGVGRRGTRTGPGVGVRGAEMRTRCGRGRATVARLGGQGGPWGVDGANSGSAQACRLFAPCEAPLASVDRRTPAWYSNSTSCDMRALHDKHAPMLGLAIRGMCALIVDAAPTLAAPTPRPRATAMRALAGDPVAGLRRTAQRPGEPVDVEDKLYVSKGPHARAPERDPGLSGPFLMDPGEARVWVCVGPLHESGASLFDFDSECFDQKRVEGAVILGLGDGARGLDWVQPGGGARCQGVRIQAGVLRARGGESEGERSGGGGWRCRRGNGRVPGTAGRGGCQKGETGRTVGAGDEIGVLLLLLLSPSSKHAPVPWRNSPRAPWRGHTTESLFAHLLFFLPLPAPPAPPPCHRPVAHRHLPATAHDNRVVPSLLRPPPHPPISRPLVHWSNHLPDRATLIQPRVMPSSPARAAPPSFIDGREYELNVRQQPKQARMCGVGGTPLRSSSSGLVSPLIVISSSPADRRPIDPPPIVQLRVINHDRRNRGSPSPSPPPPPPQHPQGHTHESPLDASMLTPAGFGQTFLQNPYYFMFASLAKPDDDTELHWMKDGKTRCTTGSVVSSLYHLKDSENENRDAGFFVFPDLSVRQEGSYRLKLSLFEVVGSKVYHCKSIFSAPFYVYTAKKFPGMEESTPLSCSLADQGIKIRIRKDIRQRKPRGSGPPFPTMPLPHPLPQPEPIPDDEDVEQDSEPEEDKGRKRSSATVERDDRDREPKRARVDPDSSGEWSIDPTLAPAPQVSASASAPPTSAVSTGSSGYDHHRPTLQAIPPPPHPPTAASHHYAPHHAYEPPPPPPPQHSHPQTPTHPPPPPPPPQHHQQHHYSQPPPPPPPHTLPPPHHQQPAHSIPPPPPPYPHTHSPYAQWGPPPY
ncbi:hypothetical protein HETIRDRAFT_117016, partial [Heterobasidion irregulare TC 32-1]